MDWDIHTVGQLYTVTISLPDWLKLAMGIPDLKEMCPNTEKMTNPPRKPANKSIRHVKIASLKHEACDFIFHE